ncbi:amidohydrolase [Novosphingobium sediminis]|uniref:Amidohydrolase n=1 Tax=Novosphingobium sediminis TaxID=707214 RepID=A0A512AGZ2_9SPHN|nr:amidohydrolase [Novosphingobium sediminis]GEN98984.1 amidohydrolase [Novosphingobium sediminis]
MAGSLAITRRGFIGSGGALGLAGISPRAMAAILDPAPTRIFKGARIHTLDPAIPSADAIALAGSRIVGVGTWAELKTLASAGTEVIDLGGQTIVPGFNDCHLHAQGEMLLNAVFVGNPFEVEFYSIDRIVGLLKERAAKTPPGKLVSGEFYDDTKIKDGRPVLMADLDRVSTEHPVMITHRGGHTFVVNSVAFKLAGITRDTPDPFGGTYDRDANGNLTGRVTDLAIEPIMAKTKEPDLTPEQKRARAIAGAAKISEEFVRYGLTSVCHSGQGLSPFDDVAAIQQIRREGRLKHRVTYEPDSGFLDAMIANGVRTGFGDEWIRIGATSEQTADGSFSERTMSRSTPYPGRTPAYYGNLTMTQEAIDALVEKLFRAGIQPNFHANGDVAIAMVLSAYEKATKLLGPADRRPKITHCTNVSPALVARIKALGAVPALFTSYAYYNADKFHFYGAEMMEHMMAYRMLIDAGVAVCAGSDFQPGPFSPLMGLQGMVTRKGWNGEVWGASQKITVMEGLKVLSSNGAHASFEEDLKGTLSPGKLADMVILDGDPAAVDPEKIKDIRVAQTIVGGEVRYKA